MIDDIISYEMNKVLNGSLKIDGLKTKLFPYQVKGVEFFIKTGGRAILADPM